jgi:hypothetical protein
VPISGSLIDPALPEITTASPLLHHSLGHDSRDRLEGRKLPPRVRTIGARSRSAKAITGQHRSDDVPFQTAFEIRKRNDKLAQLNQALDRSLQSPTALNAASGAIILSDHDFEGGILWLSNSLIGFRLPWTLQ